MSSAVLNIAIRAARAAGNVILRSLGQVDTLQVVDKGRNDFVSEVDRQAEMQIIRVIRRAYPDHSILAEESGEQGDNPLQWIIDPLDGTTNFLHGFPVFCVSIALRAHGRMECGVVYDPLREELFTAVRGGGAQLDGRRIRVSRRTQLEESLIGTGIPYRANLKWKDAYLGMLSELMEQACGVRRPGAAALDLCYVGAGRLDGFFEFGLAPWDLAAGSLIVREAGGRIGDFDGRDTYMETGNVVAANPKIYGRLARLLAPYYAQGPQSKPAPAAS